MNANGYIIYSSKYQKFSFYYITKTNIEEFIDTIPI